MPEQSYNFTSEEYYGGLDGSTAMREMKSGDEEIWHWPHNISEGFFICPSCDQG